MDSSGNVYVVDFSNARVQKFDPTGNFVLMFGGKVNKTKVDEAAPEAQQNLCTAASGDVCQAGASGTGNGQFNWGQIGSFIATGPSDRPYVGDEKRIQIFDPDGTFKELQPDPDGAIAAGTVRGLAFGSSSLFVSRVGLPDVVKLNTAGKVQCTMKAASPTAVAAGPGIAYVVDGTGESLNVRQFQIANCVENPSDSFGQGEITNSTGIATGTACLNSGVDIYVTNTSPSFVRAYGPTPDKLALCPKPLKAPEITAQYAVSVGAFSASVRAEIDPNFYADTTYFVQYGTAECIEGGGWEAACVKEQPDPPGPVLGAGGDIAVQSAAVPLSGLEEDTAYRFRFVAQSGGGGPTIGDEASFHTFALPEPLEPCPNEVFRTGAGAGLADCRAYEMVSPIDKEGSDIKANVTSIGNPTARNQSAPDGNKLAYSAEQRFGDGISQPFTSQYIATREEGAGWSTHSISPPRGLLIGGAGAGRNNEFKAFSGDLCKAWLVSDQTRAPALAPGGLPETNNLYERSNCGAEGYGWLGRGKVNGNVDPMEMQGASTDGSHTIMRSESHLTQDVGTQVGTSVRCLTPTTATTIAFQWLRDGAPIAGKTAATYKTEAADAGKAVQCRVRASNANAGATDVANPAWIVAPYPATVPPEAPESIAAPSTSAPLSVGGAGGQTLSCDPNAAEWSGSPSFAYRWYRNGVEIAGESNPTYLLSAGDLATAASFQCEAIGANAGASVAKTSESLSSSPAPSGPAAPVAEARMIIAGPLIDQGPMVYLDDGAELRTVCVLPDGTAGKGCTAGMLTRSTGPGYEGNLQNAISEDGKRVYWTFTSIFVGPDKIYLRENADQPQSAIGGGECTEAAKACTVEVSAGAAQFLGASGDGSKAIYLEAGIGSAGKLFEFDAPSGSSSEIADGVLGILGISEDAERVYLASTEVLDADPNSEGDVALAGEANLFLAEGGGFEFIATLPDRDARVFAEVRDPSPISAIPVGHAARVSPGGEAAAFISTGPLTGYDNSDAKSGEADTEVFRYEAASGQLLCVSCNPSGARPSGHHVQEPGKDYWAAGQIQGAAHQLYFTRNLSEDGERLFFESYEPLVLGDTNGKRDVYQWEAVGKGSCDSEASSAFSSPAGGCVSLISSGDSPQDSEFSDASPSGDDIFFRTGSNLVSSDPGQFDIYDARVEGGLPQPKADPPCEGDACQAPASPPEHPTPASSTFQGPGNVTSKSGPKRCGKGKRRVVRKGKARCVKKKQGKKNKNRGAGR